MTHENQQQNQPRKKKKWRGHRSQSQQQGQRREQHQRPDEHLRPPAARFAQTRPAARPLADQPVRYDIIERGFRRDPLVTDNDQPFYLRPGSSRS